MTVNDLSPEALERLEAKLVADLDMVRKVRALLLEHREALGLQATPAATVPPPPPPALAPSPTPVAIPLAPQRSHEEILTECLLEMPEAGFRLQQLYTALSKRLRNYPDSRHVQQSLKPFMRKGQVVVLEVGKGRAGSLYQCTLPRPNPEALSADSAPLSGESTD